MHHQQYVYRSGRRDADRDFLLSEPACTILSTEETLANLRAGIVDPIRGGVSGPKLGLGKQEQDDFYTAEENIQRKKLEVEIEETEEVARQREVCLSLPGRSHRERHAVCGLALCSRLAAFSRQRPSLPTQFSPHVHLLNICHGVNRIIPSSEQLNLATRLALPGCRAPPCGPGTVTLRGHTFLQVAAERTTKIEAEVAAMRKTFLCELCNKQYKLAIEYEVHLSSYDHNHKKVRAAQPKRTTRQRRLVSI